jgi:hypothetical protein
MDTVNKRMDLVLAEIRHQIDIESRSRNTISRTRDGTSDLVSNPKVFKSLDYHIQRLKNIAGAHFNLRHSLVGALIPKLQVPLVRNAPESVLNRCRVQL